MKKPTLFEHHYLYFNDPKYRQYTISNKHTKKSRIKTYDKDNISLKRDGKYIKRNYGYYNFLERNFNQTFANKKKDKQDFEKTALSHIICSDPTIDKETISTIRAQIQDVYNRRGFSTALKFKELLEKYIDRIGRTKFDIGRIQDIEYEIKLKQNYEPIVEQPKKLQPEHEQEVYEYLQLCLKYGIIRKATTQHPYGARVFVVVNGDGSTRLVCNYKPINQGTEDLSYPTPDVQDIISKFHGKTIYSKIDIIKAFFNVPVKESCKKYTAIITKWGKYEWNVMPFGGKNCPATWAMASDKVFHALKDVIKYVDDITIASRAENGKSEDDNHLDALEKVFERLVKYNLKIKISKCEFFKQKIEFLGCEITPSGRKPNDKYIKKILSFKHPQNLRELRAYFGAIEWISQHIYGLKKLMLPLRELLKHKGKKIKKWNSHKYVLQWEDRHQEAFLKIQQMIKNCEILAHPDFKKDFYIYTDASDLYYSGVLLQKHDDGKFVIIDMFSKMFTPSVSRKHITSKEILAIIESIKKWNQYLYGRKFHISTDAKNIVYLFNRVNKGRSNNAQHFRWVLLLSEYDFDVQHIPGVENKLADFLSRINADKLLKAEEGNVPIDTLRKNRQFDKNKQFIQHCYYHTHSIKGDNHLDKEELGLDEYKNLYQSIIKEKLGGIEHELYGNEQIFDDHLTLLNNLSTTETPTNYLYQLLTKQSYYAKYNEEPEALYYFKHYNFPTKKKHNVHPDNPNYMKNEDGHRRSGRLNKPIPYHSADDKLDKKIDRYAKYEKIHQSEKDFSEKEEEIIREDPVLAHQEREFRETNVVVEDIEEENDNQHLLEDVDHLHGNENEIILNTPPSLQNTNKNEQNNHAHPQQNEIKPKQPQSFLDTQTLTADHETADSMSTQFEPRELPAGDEPEDERNIPTMGQIIGTPLYCQEILRDRKTYYEQFTIQKLLRNQKHDSYMIIMRNYLEGKDVLNEAKTLPNYVWGQLKKGLYFISPDNELILFKHKDGKEKIVVPSRHRAALISLYHESLLTHHCNKTHIEQKLTSDGWYWCGYSNDIQTYIEGCKVCRQARLPNQRKGEMKLWKCRAFNECICIDTIGPLQTTVSGNRYVQNIIDRFTGYVVSIPCPNISRWTTTWNLLNFWIAKFGIPNAILTDNGGEYVNDVINDLTKILEINHKTIIPYMSPTNGTVERFNRTMTLALRKIAIEKNINIVNRENACWDLFIQFIAASHNNKITRRTKYSPNQLVLGRNIRLPSDIEFGKTSFTSNQCEIYKFYVDNLRRLASMDAIATLDIYDEKRKAAYDETRRKHTHEVGDIVIWWRHKLPLFGRSKYKNWWDGPYKIIEIWNNRKNVTLKNLKNGFIFNTNVTRIRDFNEAYKKQQQIEEEEKAET